MPFRIALSGLHGAQSDLKVTGNNIANSSTTGFKRSRAEFVDVYAAAYGQMASSTNGNGVRLSNIRQLFSQGNVEYTDNSTDLAVTGQGFFVVADDKGRYFTRNGAFGLDRDGKVINSTGQTLQVFPAIKVGANVTYNTGSLIDLQLSNTIGSPVATTRTTVNVNVDADVIDKFDVTTSIADGPVPAGDPINPTAGGATTFNPLDPTTYNHVTATTVYDTLGAAHVQTLYFRKLTGGGLTNSWQTYNYIDGKPVEPAGDPGIPNSPGPGLPGFLPPPGNPPAPAVLEFATDGTLLQSYYWDTTTNSTTASVIPGRIQYEATPTLTGSAPLALDLDFTTLTQFGSGFAVNELSQDGFTTGRLTGFDVADNGVVFARYTNGNKDEIGMVALGNVPNPQGLRNKGDSLWVESFEAGDTILGQPGSASLGLIQAGALEGSTVELADELVQMIVAQRNYQANAQVITTADQITQTLLNIR